MVESDQEIEPQKLDPPHKKTPHITRSKKIGPERGK